DQIGGHRDREVGGQSRRIGRTAVEHDDQHWKQGVRKERNSARVFLFLSLSLRIKVRTVIGQRGGRGGGVRSGRVGARGRGGGRRGRVERDRRCWRSG